MVGANCSVFGCLSGNAKYVYLREKNVRVNFMSMKRIAKINSPEYAKF